MNNLDKMLYLKMGNKLIFKEPLKGIKYAVEQYKNPNSDLNRNDRYNIYKPMSNQQSNIPKPNIKRNYQNMDVIPKFIDYENSQEMNKELAKRLVDKKAKLNIFINAYVSGEQNDFTKQIMDIELEMDKYKSIMENQKDKDFEGYKNLLSFINNNRTNANLNALENISLNEYRNMNYDTKKRILSGIFENRESFAKKLDIMMTTSIKRRTNTLSYKIPANMDINNMNPNNINQFNDKYNYENNYNDMNYQKRENNQQIPNPNQNQNYYNIPITQEQIDLFKIVINNPKIPNNHAQSYFNKSNPKVMDAAEKYFKNIYGLDYITLNYKYNNKGSKIHKFRFSGNVDALFLAAQEDYIAITKPRLFLANGNEILKDKKIKCIGALNLENNSTISVW